MSDNEDDFMCEDEEDYGLEYSEESGSEPDTALENQYYAAKACKADGNLKETLRILQEVVTSETEKGEWGFKALKQMTKINFCQEQYDVMLGHYKNLLAYIKSAVTKNYAEKSINSILDYVSTTKRNDLLLQFYQITLEGLKSAKNERLWFKTNIKVGKLYLDQREFDKLESVIKQLRASCKTDDGAEDQKKGTQLLEIYALEIQMHTEMNNNKALQQLYEQAMSIKGGIPHPLIMGTIRECGGKMFLRIGDFTKAHVNFFEAFKNFDESGSAQRIVCLKYLVLASMLMKSDINPFESQDTKSFSNDPEIVVMVNLVAAYQINNVDLFQQIVAENYESVMSDPFIKEYIEDLLSNMRIEVLLTIIRPYTRVRLDYLAQELKISLDELGRLLVAIIQDGKSDLKIDQTNGYLSKPIDEYANIDVKRYNAFSNMVKQLEGLNAGMREKVM